MTYYKNFNKKNRFNNTLPTTSLDVKVSLTTTSLDVKVSNIIFKLNFQPTLFYI